MNRSDDTAGYHGLPTSRTTLPAASRCWSGAKKAGCRHQAPLLHHAADLGAASVATAGRQAT